MSVAVSGLPAGVSYDAVARAIRGSLAYSLVNLSTSKTDIRTQTYGVTITATANGKSATPISFSWQIRDSHFRMPNYLGKYGCGADPDCKDGPAYPNVGRSFAVRFGCTASSQTEDTITYQSVAPGTIVAWGQSVQFNYARPSC